MMRDGTALGSASNEAHRGGPVFRRAVALLAGGMLLTGWCFVCLAWQEQLVGGLRSEPRIGGEMSQPPVPLARVPAANSALPDRNRYVVVEVAGLRFLLPPGGRYLAVSWPKPLKSEGSHRLNVTWSGPAADWPESRRFPKLHWRVYRGDLLARIPRVPGLLRIAGGEVRALPFACTVMGSDVPLFSWYRPEARSAWQWAMWAFGVWHIRRTIAARCTEGLLRAGAVPWVARARSQTAMATVARMSDRRIFQIALGRGQPPTKAAVLTRVVARQLVWSADNWSPPSVVIACPLRGGYLYVYPDRRGRAGLPHGEGSWKWLLLGSNGMGLALGSAVVPKSLGLRGVAVRIVGAAGLTSGVPRALASRSAMGSSPGGLSGVPRH